MLQGNLTVEFLSSVTNAEKLQKAVQGVGYDLLIEDENETAGIPRSHSRKEV